MSCPTLLFAGNKDNYVVMLAVTTFISECVL